ncbi:hypothetical protein [Saccharothrix lopnurensis]|uniref:Phage-related minor tail protein n=1 Tax=Saccharothrix lopnurensis TaxID=1670621 RepID=A0ABW1P6U0_9PSEU
MGNEVQIVVTGRNKFGPTQAAVTKQIAALKGSLDSTAKSAADFDERMTAIAAKAKDQADHFTGLVSAAGAAAKALGKLSGDTEKSVRKASKDTTDGAAEAVDKVTDLAGKAAGGLLSAGLNGARSLIGGISEGVSKAGPYVQAALVASGVTAAVVAGPLIGGALAGGVVTAFGAGIAGLGIAAAAQNSRVQAAYDHLWERITSGAKSASRPLEQVLVNFAGRAETILGGGLGASVRNSIAGIAPELDRFGDSLLKAFAKFGPALEPVSRAFGRVLDDLGPTTERVFAGIADAVTELSESVAKNPEALGDFVELMGDGVEMALDLAGALNTAHEGNKMLFDLVTTPLEWVGLKDGEEQATLTAQALTEVADTAWTATSPAQQLESAWKSLADAGDDVARRGTEVLNVLRLISGDTPTFQESQQQINDTMRALSERFGDAANHIDGFGDALINANGTVNTTTENGSYLYDQLTSLRDAFANAAASTRELEAAGYSHDEAVRMVSENLASQRNRLLDLSGKMGLTREELGTLINKMGLFPAALRTVVNVDDAAARAKLDWLLRMANAVQGASLNISVLPNGRGTQARAHGGVSGGGWTTVGELGPERVKLPPGAQVQPYTASRREMDKTGAAMVGGGAPVVLEFRSSGSSFDDVMVELLRRYVRVRGGDVQAVIGKG